MPRAASEAAAAQAAADRAAAAQAAADEAAADEAALAMQRAAWEQNWRKEKSPSPRGNLPNAKRRRRLAHGQPRGSGPVPGSVGYAPRGERTQTGADGEYGPHLPVAAAELPAAAAPDGETRRFGKKQGRDSEGPEAKRARADKESDAESDADGPALPQPESQSD
eukprot:TRINITY_DN6425_c0_g2_i3.p3 TRINITY_DN6425_c0_g2~~TRINITY_DN6425_c0_g2_i3.p3  ORF type:complete len:165 (+),score=48.50 TRINITY_DN6425_c0_g2_i3:148-642(+)